MQKCYKCGASHVVKNGKVFGWQRYKCRECGYQFTKNAPAGKPINIKLLTHMLYSAGFSMRQTANIIGVTVQSISRWIKKWHSVFLEETTPSANFVKLNAAELISMMNVNPFDEYIVMHDNLSSGAEVFITVKLPSQK